MAVSHHVDRTTSLFWNIIYPIVPRVESRACTHILTDCATARRLLSSHPFSMPPASPYQCLTLSFLLITSLIILSYFFSQFPHAPQGYSVYPSLSSLGPETKAKDIYPAEYYPGGAYVSLPFGNVSEDLTTHNLPTFLTSPSFQLCVVGPLLVIRP